MSVGTIGQDRTVKLPVPEGALAAEGVEAEGSGSGGLFGEMLAQLSGGEAKDGNEAGEQAAADDGVPQAPLALQTTPEVLQVLLTNALSTIVQDVKIDASLPAATDASSSDDVLKLAQLIAQSAKTQDDAAVAADATDGAEMKGIDTILETWANGPYSAAAPTTGAKEKRPMDLTVVNVETHFAPVVDGDIEVPAELKTATVTMPAEFKRDGGAAGVKAEITSPGAAGMTANGQAGTQSGDGDSGADTGRRSKSEAPLPDTAAAGKTGSMQADGTAQPAVGTAAQFNQYAPVGKQIAQEIARTALGAQPGTVQTLDAKPALSKLKVLQIQLQPDTLGSVTVRMALRADRLELHIEAARAETADLIQRDREMLSSLLRAVGYTADDAQIRVTHADPSVAAAMATNSDGGQGSSQSQAGSQTAGERPSGSQGRGDGDGGRRSRDAEGSTRDRDAEAARRSDTSGIYL